jgi:MFS family permease
MRRAISPARRSDLFRLYAAEVSSGAGDGIMWVALVAAVADEPRPGLWLSVIVIARLAPRALLSVPAGLLIDRLRPRSLLVGVDLVRAVTTGALGLAALGGATPTIVVALVLLSYVIGVPTRPALAAALPRVASESELATANAILSTTRQVMTFVGPLLGVGLVVSSVATGYFANAASFVVSAALYAGVGAQGWRERLTTTRGPESGSADQVGPGRAAPPPMSAPRDVVALVWVVAAMYVVRGAEMVLWGLLVTERLGASASAFGYLAGAVGLGAVVATPVARWSADSARSALAVLLGVGLTVVPTAALAGTNELAVAIALLILVGAGMVVFEVVSVVLIQRVVPLERLGTVFGRVNAASNGGKLIGAVAAPAMVAGVGVGGALLGVVAAVSVVTVFAAPGVRRLAAQADERRRRLDPMVDVLAALDLFDGASRSSLERLAAEAREEHLAVGTVVVAEGEPSDDLFVALDGEFDVTANGSWINEMGPGDWFGEIGLVDRIPRTATVVVSSEATVWRIPGELFLGVLEESGSPPTALVEGIADRLATGRAG